MKFALSDTQGSNTITAYAAGQFTVANRQYSGSLLVSMRTVSADWPVTSVEQIDADAVQQLLDAKPVTLIIGTGATLEFPDSELLEKFAAQRVGVEIMDTPAACRTYNILVAEGRDVLAALIPV